MKTSLRLLVATLLATFALSSFAKGHHHHHHHHGHKHAHHKHHAR